MEYANVNITSLVKFTHKTNRESDMEFIFDERTDISEVLLDFGLQIEMFKALNPSKKTFIATIYKIIHTKKGDFLQLISNRVLSNK